MGAGIGQSPGDGQFFFTCAFQFKASVKGGAVVSSENQPHPACFEHSAGQANHCR